MLSRLVARIRSYSWRGEAAGRERVERASRCKVGRGNRHVVARTKPAVGSPGACRLSGRQLGGLGDFDDRHSMEPEVRRATMPEGRATERLAGFIEEFSFERIP